MKKLFHPTKCYSSIVLLQAGVPTGVPTPPVQFEISQSACAKTMRENGCQNTYVRNVLKTKSTVAKFFEALKRNLEHLQYGQDVNQTIYSFLKYIGDTPHIVLSKLIKQSSRHGKKPIMLISERPLLARCMQEEIDFYSTQQKVLESVAPIGGSDVYCVERLNELEIQSALNEKIYQKKELLYRYYQTTFDRIYPELNFHIYWTKHV